MCLDFFKDVAYCSDDPWVKDAAMQFSEVSGGMINGCIGVADEWGQNSKTHVVQW